VTVRSRVIESAVTVAAACYIDRMRLATLAILLALSACAAPKTEMVACPPEGCPKEEPARDDDPVRQRAAFDLQCPANKLEIVEIDFMTRGARGCGRQGTYKRRPGFLSDWVMDAASNSASAASAPASSP
jgi:hypothetical protein